MTHRFDQRFRVKVRFDADDGVWYADCLDLQGCHTAGDTEREAIENLAEAILDRLAASLEFQGSPRPDPSHWRVTATPSYVEVSA